MQLLDQLMLPPIHHTLGGHDLAWDAEQQQFSVKYLGIEAFTNPSGNIEGGMICAMLDDAMGLFTWLTHPHQSATTTHLTMDFLRPCAVAEVLVQCQFLKQGKKILNIDASAWQNQHMVARSTAGFLLLNH